MHRPESASFYNAAERCPGGAFTRLHPFLQPLRRHGSVLHGEVWEVAADGRIPVASHLSTA